MAPIAVSFGVLELTGSALDAAVVLAAPTLASVFVLLFGGVVADRTSRKVVIVCSELVAMSAQMALAYLFIAGAASVTSLTAFMLLNGVAMAFHGPAAGALIVQLVEREELQATNALLGVARNGAMMGGAALGGLLVAVWGSGVTLLLDAISFGISAMLVLSLRARLQQRPAPASLLTDLRLGWREFTSHTWLWVIVLQFSLVVASYESTMGLLGPAVARSSLGGPLYWGFIAAGFGAGTLLGGLWAMSIRPRHPMLFATCCVFFFSSLPLALSVPLPVWLIVPAAFVCGFTGQLFGVLWYTTLQKKIPEQLLSRVSAYDHLGSIALAPLGLLAAGLLYESLGARLTLLLAAALIIVPTIFALLVRDVRQMTVDEQP